MNIVTTRGCPYHCNWCAKPIYGQRYTTRTPQRVATEIESLLKQYRPDHLWIADDIFGLKPGWIEQFAAIVTERRAVVPFKCLMRADGVTESTARALRSAGCRTVWVGAESGSQRVLDWMEKGTRVDQIETAARRLHAENIAVGFFLQFGYPGETLDDIQLTLDMVRRCRPDDIGVSVSYPLPGTKFYERVKADLGEKQNWVDSERSGHDVSRDVSSGFLSGVARARPRRIPPAARSRSARYAGAPSHRLRPRTARELRRGPVQAFKRPGLRRTVEVLARQAAGGPSTRPTPVLMPMLSQQAAAVPSEQAQ